MMGQDHGLASIVLIELWKNLETCNACLLMVPVKDTIKVVEMEL